jgi:hypothetical protein
MPEKWVDVISSIKKSSMPDAMKVACVAQAILESGRGTSRVAEECLNFWGMKMRPELAAIAVGKEILVDSENEGKAVFAQFSSTDMAVSGWLIFLSRPFYLGWDSYKEDSEGFIRHIGKSWCPQDGYADKVINLIPEALDLLRIEELPQPPPPDFKLIERGSFGPDVELLQKELNDHYDAELEIDGDFGSNTEAAVKKVEALLGNKVDGVVDSAFWSALLTLQGLQKDLTPSGPTPKGYMPFAIRMSEITTRWTYKGNWPEGAIVHFTAGRDDPRGTVQYLGRAGYPCIVVARDGKVYQAFPANRGGYHCGTHHHSYSVGIEIISAGRCTPIEMNGRQRYAPWFAFQDCDPETNQIERVSDCFEESEMRYVRDDCNCIEGWYQKYTDSQEASLTKILLWYKWADATNRFNFDNVFGHDEACDQVGDHGAKNDPGGALSMTMPRFRKHLSDEWVKLNLMTVGQQESYFSNPY